MFTWPETLLPLPSQTFDVEAEFANIRSKMDSGRVRQRPRFTKELELSSVRFELSRVQYSIFKAVWVRELGQGNDWFTMRLPIANGAELTLAEIRFVSDYRANHRTAGNWDISATIEYREPTTISQDLLNLHYLYGVDLSQFQAEMAELETIFPTDWESITPLGIVAFFGDSQTDRHSEISGTTNSYSYVSWVRALNGELQQVAKNTARGDWDFGYSSQTSEQLLPLMTDVIASTADTIIIQAGINSVTGNEGAEKTIADTIALWDAALSAGKQVVGIEIFPHGLIGYKSTIDPVNAALALAASPRGIPWITFDDTLRIGGDPAAALDSQYTNDASGTHLSALGALRIAEQVLPQIQPFFTNTFTPIPPQDDASWITPNSHFEDGIGSGTPPTDWTLVTAASPDNASITYTTEVDPGGGPDWVKCVVTNNAGRLSWLRNYVATGFTVGENVTAVAEVDILAGSTFNVFDLNLVFQGGASTGPVANLTANGELKYADTFTGVLMTGTKAVPTSTTQLRHQIQFYGNGTFRFRKAGVYSND
tara:strand:- start:7064 stop:8680 length:1617 start_codon:yes stop_codon:yes gene_type:complete